MILKPLNGGEVELIDHMGDDLAIINAAKVSTGRFSRTFGDNERRLLAYLWNHKHTSPFEQVVFKFRLRLPIFVMRQLVRYRTARLNELSGRYAELPGDFYVPSQLFYQHESNKQKGGEPFSKVENTVCRRELTAHSKYCYDMYQWALEYGISREQARLFLPVNFFTECIWQIDLHNLIKFLLQRLSFDAQDEIRWYAQAIGEFVAQICPETWELLRASLPPDWVRRYSETKSHPTPTQTHQDQSQGHSVTLLRGPREEEFHSPLPK